MDMHDLSLRDLKAVAAVAAHGHFGRAAEALRIAQPTLSAQIQKVERLLNIQLFDRSGRRFVITPEGTTLLPIIRDLLAGVDRLHTAAAASTAALTPLRLGVIPTLAPYLMPYLLVRDAVGTRAPTLDISEQVTASLVQSLLAGELDVMLASAPIRHDSFDCLPLFDEPFRLLAPRNCSLLDRRRLDPASLSITDMVLLDEGHCLRDQALELCGKRRGVQPRLIATSLETLKYVVASGGGYSLLPLLASQLPKTLETMVVVRDFDDRAPFRRIGLYFRRSLPRRAEIVALAAFIRGRLPAGVRASPDRPTRGVTS